MMTFLQCTNRHGYETMQEADVKKHSIGWIFLQMLRSATFIHVITIRAIPVLAYCEAQVKQDFGWTGSLPGLPDVPPPFVRMSEVGFHYVGDSTSFLYPMGPDKEGKLRQGDDCADSFAFQLGKLCERPGDGAGYEHSHVRSKVQRGCTLPEICKALADMRASHRPDESQCAMVFWLMNEAFKDQVFVRPNQQEEDALFLWIDELIRELRMRQFSVGRPRVFQGTLRDRRSPPGNLDCQSTGALPQCRHILHNCSGMVFGHQTPQPIWMAWRADRRVWTRLAGG